VLEHENIKVNAYQISTRYPNCHVPKLSIFTTKTQALKYESVLNCCKLFINARKNHIPEISKKWSYFFAETQDGVRTGSAFYTRIVTSEREATSFADLVVISSNETIFHTLLNQIFITFDNFS